MSRWTFLPLGGPYELAAAEPQDWNYDPTDSTIAVDVAVNDGFEWDDPHRGVLVLLPGGRGQFNPDQLSAFISVLQEAQRLVADRSASSSSAGVSDQ